MADEHPTSKDSSTDFREGGTSALHKEAKHVENIAQSKDASHGDDDTELVKSEKKLQVGQEARVQQVGREARESGAGSTESQERLNQDG